MEQEEKYFAELIEAGDEFDYKIQNIRIVVMHASLFQDAKKMEMAKKYLKKYGKIITFYFKYILNIIFIGFKLLDEKEEYVGNLNEELPKVTLFSTKLIEY